MGPATNFSHSFFTSLTRGRVYSFQLLQGITSAIVFSLSRRTLHSGWGSRKQYRSMQSNVEFGYQLSICSGTKENHGKPWSRWPVTGPSGCKLTSSQQSGIKYVSPNISPYLAVALLKNIYKLFLQICLCAYDLDNHKTVYNTCGRNKRIYAQICIQMYIYLYLWFSDYR
jgi:hypothetical protein